jgi:hypothetical protein
VKQTFTTAYHPQTNGKVERHNRNILSQLRKYIGGHQDDWDLFNGALTYAYNTQLHSSTGHAPFQLILSRPSKLTIIQPSSTNIDVTLGKSQIVNFRLMFLQRVRRLQSNTDTAIRHVGLLYQRNADRNSRTLDPQNLVCHRVWIRAEIRSKKLSPKLNGPYTVIGDR